MNVMTRVVVLSALIAVGPVPAAFADGPVMQSATRLAKQAGRQSTGANPAPVQASLAAQQGNLSTSNMSKGKKLLLALVAGAGVVGTVWVIDHRVLDNTPSSLGLRKD